MNVKRTVAAGLVFLMGGIFMNPSASAQNVLLGNSISISQGVVKTHNEDKSSVEESVANLAKELIHVPYKEGGITPDGFDTSGFTQYVFKNSAAKVTLPRMVNDQFKKGIQVKKKENLLMGDLLFFKVKNKLQSVGIYLENGQFVTVTEKGVSLQNLEADYWKEKERYCGAKRLISPSMEIQQQLRTMYDLAKEGKVLDCDDFRLGDTREAIVKKWGNPDAKIGEIGAWIIYKGKGIKFLLDEKGVVEAIWPQKQMNFSSFDIQKTLGVSDTLEYSSGDNMIAFLSVGSVSMCLVGVQM